MTVNRTGFKELYFADSYMSPLSKGKISQFFKWVPVILNRFFHLMMQWSIVTDYRLAKRVIAHIEKATELSDLKILEVGRNLLQRNPHNQELNNAVVRLEGRVRNIEEQRVQIDQLTCLQVNKDQQMLNAQAEVYQLRVTLAASQTALATSQNDHRYLQSVVAQNEQQLNAKQSEINHYQQLLSNKERELYILQNHMADLQGRFDRNHNDLISQIAEKENEIKLIKLKEDKALNEAKKKIRKQKLENNYQNLTIETLQNEITELNFKVEEFMVRNEQLEFDKQFISDHLKIKSRQYSKLEKECELLKSEDEKRKSEQEKQLKL